MANADLNIINYEVKIVLPPKSNTKKASVARVTALRYHGTPIVRTIEMIAGSWKVAAPRGLKPAARS